jgi:hypothetical protein
MAANPPVLPDESLRCLATGVEFKPLLLPCTVGKLADEVVASIFAEDGDYDEEMARRLWECGTSDMTKVPTWC